MVCLENVVKVVLVVSPCLPFPSATRRGDTGDFRGRSCIARGVGSFTDRGNIDFWGGYMGQGRLVAIVLVVLVMLARTTIASVVLVVLSRAAMVVLVEAGAMVAVASVVAGAMVVARSAGGISPIYMVDVGAVLPADGAVEVVCVAVFAPLSGREVAAYLAVAALPSVGVDVAIAIDAVEVGEVDTEDAVAVARSDTQFGYHLVGNDGGFRSHVGQSLGRGGDDHDEAGYGC